MRAVTPYVEVPGDNDKRIMAHGGACMGMTEKLAVWRFGFLPDSPASRAYGVSVRSNLPPHFLANRFMWVLATRKSGKVKDEFFGFAIELPDTFRKVIDW